MRRSKKIPPHTLRAISLCSGVGGLDLAAHWGGEMAGGKIETVLLCEADAYCREILALRFPGVSIVEDIRDVSRGKLTERGIDPDSIDLVFGGIPCQGNSQAGKRRGRADPRNLWPQTKRILCELGPRYAVVENVDGLRSVGVGDDGQPAGLFGEILRDLAALGYHAGWLVLGAADAGAPHQRDRICIIGYRVADADQHGGRRQERAVA